MDFQLGKYFIQAVSPIDFVVNARLLPIFNQYKDVITDDYWTKNQAESDNAFRGMIAMYAPFFWACYDDEGNCIGFIYLNDWRNGRHSCAIHIVIDEAYRGHVVISSIKRFLNMVFNYLGVRRVEGCSPIYNKKCIAFMKISGLKEEGVNKGASLKNGKPLDYVMFGLTKEMYNGKTTSTANSSSFSPL